MIENKIPKQTLKDHKYETNNKLDVFGINWNR